MGSRNVPVANTQRRPGYGSGESVCLNLVHRRRGLASGTRDWIWELSPRFFSLTLLLSHFLLGAIFVKTTRHGPNLTVSAQNLRKVCTCQKLPLEVVSLTKIRSCCSFIYNRVVSPCAAFLTTSLTMRLRFGGVSAQR